MLHKWWFWVILIILILVIGYFVWYFIAKRRAEKEGREMTPFGPRARKAAAGVAAAGVIGGGAAGTAVNQADPLADDGNPALTSSYRAENDSATVSSQASSLKEQASSDQGLLEALGVGNTKEARSTATKIYANKNSKVYHLPGQQVYKIKNPDNWVTFNSEAQAIAAGYTAAKR